MPRDRMEFIGSLCPVGYFKVDTLLDDVVRAFTEAKSPARKRKLSELAALVVAPGADETELRIRLTQFVAPCSAMEVNSGCCGREAEGSSLALERACTVLDRSSPWVPCCPPAKPASYAGGFKPSDYEPGYLQMVHPHSRDSRLNFEAAFHTYFVDGRAATGSVTYLAGSSSKAFDGEGAVLMMRASRSQAWPRLQYVRGAMHQPELNQLAALDGLGIMIVQVTGSERKTRAAILPQENFLTCSKPAAIKELRTFGFCTSHRASVKPSTSLASTYIAASPATSGIEALAQVITGQPQANASATGIPKPSYKEG